MSTVSVEDFRATGPGASFGDDDESAIQWHLEAVEAKFASYIGSRGYDNVIASAGLDYQLAVIQVATWNLMVAVRGVNPADPAHAALKIQHDEAMSWVRDVASGKANLDTGAAPARKRTMTARVFSALDDTSDNDGTRGW